MVSEPDFARGLELALVDISTRIGRCDFALPEPPASAGVDPTAVNLVFTSGAGEETLLGHDPSPSCTDGWRYTPDRKRVVLCSATCELARADLDSTLEFLFGCATVLR